MGKLNRTEAQVKLTKELLTDVIQNSKSVDQLASNRYLINPSLPLKAPQLLMFFDLQEGVG